MMKMLDGNKTYLVAALIGLATAALNLGWIDTTVYQWALGILAPTGIATMRAAIRKGEV